MRAGGESQDYKLKLKPGDQIQCTIESVSGNGASIDTSLWGNVDTAVLADVNDNSSLAPGSTLYGEVTSISDRQAELVQQRGMYRRNHLPGDTLRVSSLNKVSSSMYRAVPEDMKNLEALYVPGLSIGSEATVKLAKIRSGTGIALPVTIHDEGLVPGSKLTVDVTAGSQESFISEVDGKSLAGHGVPVELESPAWTTGPATIRLTDYTQEGGRARIVGFPGEIPEIGATVEAKVSQRSGETSVSIHEDSKITVQFDQPAPLDGVVSIELTGKEQGVFTGAIRHYIEPELHVEKRYHGRVSSHRNRAQIDLEGETIPVSIRDTVPATGKATIRIVDITDKIYGEVVGDIEERTLDEADSTDVDVTNLSKL